MLDWIKNKMFGSGEKKKIVYCVRNFAVCGHHHCAAINKKENKGNVKCRLR